MGTRSFRLLTFRIDDRLYGVTLADVVRIVDPLRAGMQPDHDLFLDADGDPVPPIDLSESAGGRPARFDGPVIVVSGPDDRQLVLVCDSICDIVDVPSFMAVAEDGISREAATFVADVETRIIVPDLAFLGAMGAGVLSLRGM